ncbi:AAEL006485-PB [Aedes aegypti]|uniref:Inosine/uridine-preferring nucleoside hydrolase domain-containing protein n=2 Tax=Aedes aegypti TaxID=7159 RepID=A0A8W7HKC9_AEDAE|nr:probable uridine nucleosidase 1 [Aedes aegypti]XP_001651979.1 probable uridine nucleosidase 1 [Aedes aegypti]EAT41911.1 AAEL006485-PA [Aedes aegypti]EAT41912.1 AAEL006485-PC [Aedes aegypti]EAT41913.1 AAEL006485-PB [Aedes aegypti]
MLHLVGLLLLTYAVAVPLPCSEKGIRRVIIDQDGGGDDGWALLMMLMNEKKYNVVVEAITCTHGNTDLENSVTNAARILEGLGRRDVPLYRGASERLITPAPRRDVNRYFWGVDGFGDVQFQSKPDLGNVPDEHAVVKMHELIRKYPRQISILCLGPLTNLAMLFKMFPSVKSEIAGIYILGGNRNGVGNTDFAAEFNFFTDPEAANIVMNNAPVILNIVPWETVLDLETIFPMEWRNSVFKEPKNKAIEVLNQVEEVIYANISNWQPCDMYAAAVLLNNCMIADAKRYKADVELAGKVTRGMMAILYHDNDEKDFNVNVIDGIEEDTLRQMVEDLNR